MPHLMEKVLETLGLMCLSWVELDWCQASTRTVKPTACFLKSFPWFLGTKVFTLTLQLENPFECYSREDLCFLQSILKLFIHHVMINATHSLSAFDFGLSGITCSTKMG